MKRFLDIVFVLVGAIVLLPAFVVVALLVRVKLGRPVLFFQDRPGLSGKVFRMVKFRSMTDQRNSEGELMPDSVRLSSVGRLLRETSVDELPEFWNVLTGDMSLVGPRPLLVEYLPLYTERQNRRHEVRPGITGWAQVNGRNALSWEERLEMDVWYVANRSLWLDLKIVAMTVRAVLSRKGVSASGEATMTKFTGKPEKTDKENMKS